MTLTLKFNSVFEKIAHYAVILLAFFLPLHGDLANAMIIVLFLVFLLSGLKRNLHTLSHSPIAIVLFLFFAIHTLSLFFTPAFDIGRSYYIHQIPLFLAPFIFTVVKDHSIKYALNAFVISMMISLFFSYGCLLDLWTSYYLHGTSFFLSRLNYAVLLAFAIMLLLHWVFTQTLTQRKKYLFITLIALSILNLFMSEGRAGQAALALMLFIYFIYTYRSSIKKLSLALLSIMILFVGSYFVIPSYHDRINIAVDTILHLEKDTETGLGCRLNTAINASYIIREHPLLGTGLGSFRQENLKVTQTVREGAFFMSQPHNYYILTQVQFGLFGTLLLLSIFFFLYKHAKSVNDDYKIIRILFPSMYLAIMFSDIYLYSFSTQHFFIFMTILLYRRADV